MTRRGFFASIGAFALAVETAKSKVLGWGFMNMNRHFALRAQGVWLKVMLNGEDVSNRCFEADDQLGYVGLFKHRNGQPYLDYSSGGPELAREFLHGRVEFLQK